MPDLYFVVLLFGMVGGALGPLPLDKFECDLIAAQLQHEEHLNWQGDTLHVNGQKLKKSDVQFKCEHHLIRPQVDSGLKQGV